jgi:hypothetical protein
VSGFSAEWLALREPADAAARSSRLVSFVVAQGRLLDLGGGTGANIRYLSPHLPVPQQWTLIDSDRALLARVQEGVNTVQADLNDVVDDGEMFQDCALVTAAALLDLVSDDWLQRLVERCRAAEAAVLFALNYDGRIECAPADPEDDEVRRLVNEHQRTDKGFGPALGPDAGKRAIELLHASRYDVRYERSDWVLGAEFGELQRQLIDGWVSAAADMAPDRRRQVEDWRRRRLEHLDGGRSRILVGHLDVAALPFQRRRTLA